MMDSDTDTHFETAPKPTLVPELHEIYQADFYSTCSTRDFLAHMPASVICREVKGVEDDDHLFRVFWYPTQADEQLQTNFISSGPGSTCGGSLSIQHKIKYLLSNFKILGELNRTLVQFWAPIEQIGGGISLVTSEQPFGFDRVDKYRDGLYSGLCRYRYRRISNTEYFPVWRAFTQGCIQFCPNIELYFENEFPLKNYAICCGIGATWAVPLFEQSDHQRQHCVGVLEFLMSQQRSYIPKLPLEDLGLITASTNSHCKDFYSIEWNRILKDSQVDMGDVMKLVREERGLPVVQLWIPCNCNCICDDTNGHDTCLNIAPHLFCLVTSCSDWGIKYQQELNVIQHVPEAYFVNSGGKSCIGRTHSLKKPSFHRYTNFFDISDYPPVTLTRSVGLQACFAIPMNLIHYQLRPSILEFFLPPLPVEKGDIGDLVALLKSLLTTLAQVFSTKNSTFGLREGEEFCVEISHEKDYDDDDDIHKFCYFNVCRAVTTTMNTGEGEGDRILEDDDWDDPMLAQPSNAADDHVQQYHQTIGSLQLLVLDHHLQTHETEQHFPSSIQPTSFEASNTQDDIANQQLEANDDHQIVNVEKQFSSSDQPPSSEAITSRKSSTSGQIEITLDMIKPHMSIKQKDAADKLGVSKSTLKRRCRDFGINRWPSQKRNKVHRIQPVQGLFTQSVQIDSSGGIQNSNPISNAREKHAAAANSIPKNARGKSPVTRDDDEVDQSYTLIVEATYREDVAKFDFCSNSGLEELRRELDENFEFEGEMFKIKYKDGDGKWIIMPHDKSLRFHMKNLKTLGQTKMELSISLVTN